jgi:hypothetical protein
MRKLRLIGIVTLTALVLAAGSNFFVSVHHCGKSIRGIAFLETADGCGHGQLPPCHRKLMKGCCEDETIYHQAQDFQVTASALELQPVPVFDIVQPLVLIAEIIPVTNVFSAYADYDPPLRVRDITTDLQVFII